MLKQNAQTLLQTMNSSTDIQNNHQNMIQKSFDTSNLADSTLSTQSIPSMQTIPSIISTIDLNNLPEDLNISTMTITFKFDTLMNLENISKYMDLKFGGIVRIEFGDEGNTRTLIKSKRRKKRKIKRFNNQATLFIDTKNNQKRKKKPVNTKIFINGAVQMTGCNSMAQCIEAINILCCELCNIKAVYDKNKKKIIKKPFVSNMVNLNINNVKDFNIGLINTDFHVGFLIDRLKLFKILTKKKIVCTYEPCIHACVNIKYHYNINPNEIIKSKLSKNNEKKTDKISIFVFESGSIIITGAKTKDHIIKSYDFINSILAEHYGEIVKNNIDKFLNRQDIQKLIIDNS